VADLTLDRTMLQEALRKRGRPVERRAVTRWMHEAYRVSLRKDLSRFGNGDVLHAVPPGPAGSVSAAPDVRPP